MIALIISNYKYLVRHTYGNNKSNSYLEYINNDLPKFIGYKVDLEKIGDLDALKLWNELDQRMFDHKIMKERKVILLLHELPLYLLLSLLGHVSFQIAMYKGNI